MFTNHGSKFTFWLKGPGTIFQKLGKFDLRAGGKRAGQIRASKVYDLLLVMSDQYLKLKILNSKSLHDAKHFLEKQ